MSARTTTKRKYGLINFAFDVILTLITSGFWLIWVFVREMRNRR
ncbi:gp096 [Rhodococcus phage ReqiPoco6]|uniref:Gp096 n=1 Tax=Rhodococcus phage ReqiPoco6 TaxID=691964 RepID=D4P7W4_9CAUD|nr:gp096 [Rhodococcus phage ReqiPoco6]ADD81094.1 gp096 [Rhodococcus phage ReqiPoco6]